MNIIINENGNREELNLIDPASDCDWIQDFIGNAGGLNDGQFSYDEEKSAYVCTEETFDWWKSVVESQQELENLKYELSEEFGSEEVESAIEDLADYELEDKARYMVARLKEVFNA